MNRFVPRTFLPVVALAALSTALAGRIFDDPKWRWWLIGVVLVTAVVALLTARLSRWLRALTAAVSVVATTTGMVRAADGIIYDDVVSAATHGAGELLSGRWPSPATPTTIGFVALVAAITAAASAQLSLRRAIGPAQLLPSTAMLGTVAILASQAGAPTATTLVAFVALALSILWFAARDRHPVLPEEDRPPQPLPFILLAGAGLLLLPVVFAGLLTTADRYDPRAQRNDPVQLEDDLSPLTVVDQLRTRTPETVLFESVGTPVSRWRLVGLSRYDGLAWMAPANLRRASSRLVDQTKIDSNGAGTRAVTVTIKDLDGQWLPTPAGRTFEVSVPVRTDANVSSLLSLKALTPGFTYRVRSNELGADESDAAAVTADRSLMAVRTGFEIPISISTLASQTVIGAVTDRQKADQLATFLRDNFQLDSTAPSGHSAGLLELFLTKTKRGRREQFVASYALLASAVGLPVRIAVGFSPPGSSGQVTSSSAMAWPEIAFETVGWRSFDPVPTSEGKTQKGSNTELASAQMQTPLPTTTPPVESSLPTAGPIVPAVRAVPVKSRLWMLSIPIVMLVGAIAYVLGILDIKKRQWDRRANADTTNGQVVGAFLNGTDRLIDLGVNLPPSGTDRELVAVGARSVEAAGELAPLADLATEAAYGTRTMVEADIEQAQSYLRQFEIASASIPRKQLWRSRLSMRSIRKGLGKRKSTKKDIAS